MKTIEQVITAIEDRILDLEKVSIEQRKLYGTGSVQMVATETCIDELFILLKWIKEDGQDNRTG